MADLDIGESIQYHPDVFDEEGFIPASTAEESRRTYRISHFGGKTRLQLPREVLDAFGIDTEETATDDLPRLDVYVGNRFLAFAPTEAVSIPPNLLPRDTETIDDEHVLTRIQTATPRIHHGNVVSVSITRGLKQADKNAGAVEFLPQLAFELDGLVPVVTRDSGDGRHGGYTRSVYRRNQNSLECALPEDVLTVLGLSTDDFRDVPADDRPSVSIFAGDDTGVLAFTVPGHHEPPLDRDEITFEGPSLTDIEGIGPALAERLSDHGLESVEKLATATREDLLKVHRLGPERVGTILSDVKNR